MANEAHLELLRLGVDVWNARRNKEPFDPNLSGVDLSGANLVNADLGGAHLGGSNLGEASLETANLGHAYLREANLGGAYLFRANLGEAYLEDANLGGAYLRRSNLGGANLSDANLVRADLSEANFGGAFLRGANLSGANLVGASLSGANLGAANLSGANLSGANLGGASLSGANLTKADLTKADLSGAAFIDTNLVDAILTGCRIYGISAWNVKLSEDTKQRDLVITAPREPEVTVDNIEVAQFVYLLLHNGKIRDVIDTIGRKGVLLLGRFTEGRIAVLERLRQELRKRGYLPIVFNFDKPETKDFTETVRLLAGLSKFVIADVTNPKSAPLELQATVPEIMVPFQPIIEKGQEPFAMLTDLWIKHRDWVFDPIHYSSVDALVASFDKEIIAPAEARFDELVMRKAETMKGRHV
jgi:uncharacterized protein YjbI with pentapeptide repeats